VTHFAVVAAAAVIGSVLGYQAAAAMAASDAVSAVDTVSAADARARCIAAEAEAPETCEVSQFGQIGAIGGRQFHYALYQYRNASNNVLDHMRVVVFEAVPPDSMRAVAMTDTDPAVSYDKPKLLHSNGRILLHIPGSESGTGNFNRERLFVWRAGEWHSVDTTAWLDDLSRRLRKSYGILKGIYPDYVTMTASTPLWRDGDGNACASAGRAELQPGWRGDRVVLRNIRRVKAGECGEPLPRRSKVN